MMRECSGAPARPPGSGAGVPPERGRPTIRGNDHFGQRRFGRTPASHRPRCAGDGPDRRPFPAGMPPGMMARQGQTGVQARLSSWPRLAMAGMAFVAVVACGADDDVPPPSPPLRETVADSCRTAGPENAPALYRCYGRSIRDEPPRGDEDRDLYAVLAATADVLAERLERRQITGVEARLLWETAKSNARSESIRRAQPPQTQPPPPGP